MNQFGNIPGALLVAAAILVIAITALGVFARRGPIATQAFGFFAAGTTIEELTKKIVDLTAQAKAIIDLADKEGRKLTPEEEATYDGILATCEETELEIKRRERLLAQEQRLNEGTGRRTQPADASAPAAAAGVARQPVTGGLPAAVAASPGTGGFRSYGEFAISIRQHCVGAGTDPRLRVMGASPTTQSQEGVGGDGGYLVPPDFRQQILSRVLGEDSLLTRCDSVPTNSNSVQLPVDEDSPWDNTSGVQVFWEGEGTTYGQSKTGLRSNNVRLNKMTALVPVTDELYEDAPAIEAYLRRKVPEKMVYKLNDGIVNGDAVGKPRGILNSPCLVTQTKKGGQAAGTVLFENVSAMYSRMPEQNRRTAVWIINQDIEPQLDSMVIPGGTGMPVYLPPGGLAERPYATLKGRPVVYTNAAAAVGTPGDILFADLGCYFAPVKSGGVKSDISIHLWFDQGLTAFRFTWRVGGQCWWSAPITRPGGKNTQSCFVALEAR
jgi:HK97 family phage major capsid protein